MKKYILLALFVLTLAGGAGWMRRMGVSDGPSSSEAEPPRSSPIDERLARPPARIVALGETVRTRVADTVQAADKAPEKELGGADWAVVAGIYKNYQAAERRAHSVSSGARYKAIVFPPDGQGTKYMVVLEDGLTHGKATQIRDAAVANGLPSDTYVTRLTYRQ